MGDLGGISWSELWILMPITFVAILVSYLLAQSLNVILLGEASALSLGVSFKRLRWQIIILTAVLAGSITAFCGPLAFVGVAVPHLSRMLFQSNRHQILILGSALVGMTILVYCQLLSQIILVDKILPINIITSILGAPAVLWIILKMRR
jgi:iron complex transport system permease protein